MVFDVFVAVMTGTQTGKVPITVEVYHTEPPLFTNGWDAVGEASALSEGSVMVHDGHGAPTEPGFPILDVTPGSSFRVRVHAKGRDAADARERGAVHAARVLEAYLVQLWPGSGPARVQKQDEFGALRAMQQGS